MQENKYKLLFYKDSLKDSSPILKLLLVFAVMFVSLMIISILSLALAVPIFHISMLQLNDLLKGNIMDLNIAMLKYFQVTQSIALFIIPSVITNYLLFKPERGFLTNSKFPPIMLVLLVLITMIISSPIINILLKWNSFIRFPSFMSAIESKLQEFENNAADLTLKLLTGARLSSFIVNILMIAIIPAIGEEFLFRGIFQRIFAEWFKNMNVAILLAAALFSAFHMQFYGFIPRFVLGVFFGYLFYWQSNIWIPVMAHFFNNSFAVTIEFLDHKNNSHLSDMLNKFQSLIPVIILSSIITVFLMYWMQKNYRIKASRTEI